MTVLDLARRSQAAASAKDRAAWLALFADDAVVEDPIGPSPLDPDGKGHRGLQAIAGFYDTVIGNAVELRFAIERTYVCGNELADVGAIHTTLPGGLRTTVHGVFTYRTDGSGKLTALRAFWEFSALEMTPAA